MYYNLLLQDHGGPILDVALSGIVVFKPTLRFSYWAGTREVKLIEENVGYASSVFGPRGFS